MALRVVKLTRITAVTPVAQSKLMSLVYHRHLNSSSTGSLATCACSEAHKNNGEGCKGNVLNVYDSMVQRNQVLYDVHQVRALTELDRLRKDLLEQKRTDIGNGSSNDSNQESLLSSSVQFATASTNSLFSLFMPSKSTNTNKISTMSISSSSSTSSLLFNNETKEIKGVYLYGGAGCGKTFCMDLFYSSFNCCDDTKKVTKQRVHFHKFMLQQVHREIHRIKQSASLLGQQVNAAATRKKLLNADEVMQRVIDNILQSGFVLCFDEFQVTDIADALILRRLFTGLISQGAKVVITSNRPPEDLYIGGIQRDLFLPFIDFIRHNMTVISFHESDTDYRLLIAAQHKARGVYFVGQSQKHLFDAAANDLIGEGDNSRSIVTSDGRKVKVPLSAIGDSIARFSFQDLCKTAMGAADYLAIGENFHTVIVEGVPKLSVLNEVNVVRRFIVFVDSMYECNVKLVIHAEASPSELFNVETNLNSSDEAFAVDRTRSRLEEMGSETYLRKRWIGTNNHAPDRCYLSN